MEPHSKNVLITFILRLHYVVSRLRHVLVFHAQLMPLSEQRRIGLAYVRCIMIHDT